MTPRSFAAFALVAAAASAALANPVPIPKVMSDAPPDRGSWRMELLESTSPSAAKMKQMGPMTICQTAGQAMARQDAAPKDTQCTHKLAEDTASRAVVDISCTGPQPMTMRSTIVRTGPRVYEIANDTTRGGKTETMRMKMSYVGACSEKDAVVTMPKNAEACQRGAAQMARMNPDTACKGMAGPQRDQCVQQMTQMRAQFEQMCK